MIDLTIFAPGRRAPDRTIDHQIDRSPDHQVDHQINRS